MAIVTFLIGDERGLFKSNQDYMVVFDDVEGLKRGSPVRMGGIDVGSVSGIRYSDDANDPRLYVVISVAEDEARRIRADSQASISPKGLLGDKMLTITVGTAEKEAVPAGGVIQTGEGSGLDRFIGKVDRLGDRAEKVMINLETTTNTLADENFRKDLQAAVKSLSGILKSLDEGDGYAARLVKDPAEAQRLSRTMENLEQTSSELQQTIQGVNRIIGRVNQGPGFAHDVIYGDTPTKSLAQFGDAAEEVALTLRGVREGNGLAHSLLYGGDETQDVMGNLTAMSSDLRQIVADVRAGKGTIGALLVDPSVYEDVKLLLGNVQRNRTLRALVRYSIKRDEKASGVEARDPKPAPVGEGTATGSGDGAPSSGRASGAGD
jgi:phospholipid/cholesterol/gamma-HCH transport system substrate-binding protein